MFIFWSAGFYLGFGSACHLYKNVFVKYCNFSSLVIIGFMVSTCMWSFIIQKRHTEVYVFFDVFV